MGGQSTVTRGWCVLCEKKKKKKKKRMRWSDLATTDRAVRHTQNHAPKFLSFVDDDVFSLWCVFL